MQVDAHQHFWRLQRGDYGWLSAAAHPSIFRDFEPGDLRPLLFAAGVERTILVQAAATVEETRFLLDLACECDFVTGVVGWAALDAAAAVQTIEVLSGDRRLVGLRPMLQDLEDDAWILRPSIAPALAAMERLGLRLDALVTPRHLAYVTRFLEAHPDLAVVIDHGAKPSIADGDIADWRRQILDIGRSSAAYCKLSGLVTEAGGAWSDEQLKPYVDVLLEAFGPQRLMWGSDWPVVNEAGGYARWREAALALTSHLDADDCAWVFGGSASTFYGLAP